jgi:hypothetical protein
MAPKGNRLRERERERERETGWLVGAVGCFAPRSSIRKGGRRRAKKYLLDNAGLTAFILYFPI